ncbi:hypothetical protein SAMD00019534_030680 [Acytostelium subglobosum LB1]|uniref:hypothetical protein n=1 Tax=Acytostelium subglobosum LB1 TaxID=1410327 RepID=UPI00064480FB|nr:hypothetical protein SAMD00019534_030680 [Acytostelium subglobosum LB1]GAM19893.1 hypothetical protein SAMD00019534_030680 [Acytostelium subglobosum LB1]|eukprot:XP_012756655.1 hypothetical protein SAMD00019534_030680 [Acytostelium subglobosum LB1]
MHQLKHLAFNHQSLEQSKVDAVKHFDDWRVFINELEKSVVGKLDTQIKKNNDTIQSIIGELGRINTILTNTDNGSARIDVDDAQLIHWITTLSNGEIIEKVFPPLPHDDIMALNNHDLLSRVKYHLIESETIKYDNPVTIRVDSIDQSRTGFTRHQFMQEAIYMYLAVNRHSPASQ